jgi:6-pyruvoyltetrahydropterin/6-carboxytetrahydropterin synthase
MRSLFAFTFEAAHYLPGAPVRDPSYCMHGHTYQVEIEAEGPIEPLTGWVVVPMDADRAIEFVRAELDHMCLNDLEDLPNSTVEHVARWIFRRLRTSIPSLVRVTVHATPRRGAICEAADADAEIVQPE